MALLFADGFDAYSTNQLASKWTNVTGGIIGGPGRLGYGQYYNLTTGGSYANISKGLRGAPYTTLIVGFAYYWNASSFTNSPFFIFSDVNGINLGVISATASGQIQYLWGTNNVVVASSPATLNVLAWAYIEAQVTFSATTGGSVTLRVNGQTVATAASVQTAANSNGCALVGPGGTTNNVPNSFFDDFYVLNTTAPNNTFLGDVKIVPLYPIGNGRVSGFTRFGGTASGNYTAVNEVPPDADVSYDYTSTPGTTDAYTITALSNVTTIKAVQVSAYARKDDTPSRVLSVGVGNGTTENFDAGSSLNTSYTYILRQMDTNPLTAAAWAPGDFTTLQLAQQLIS